MGFLFDATFQLKGLSWFLANWFVIFAGLCYLSPEQLFIKLKQIENLKIAPANFFDFELKASRPGWILSYQVVRSVLVPKFLL